MHLRGMPSGQVPPLWAVSAVGFAFCLPQFGAAVYAFCQSKTGDSKQGDYFCVAAELLGFETFATARADPNLLVDHEAPGYVTCPKVTTEQPGRAAPKEGGLAASDTALDDETTGLVECPGDAEQPSGTAEEERRLEVKPDWIVTYQMMAKFSFRLVLENMVQIVTQGMSLVVTVGLVGWNPASVKVLGSLYVSALFLLLKCWQLAPVANASRQWIPSWDDLKQLASERTVCVAGVAWLILITGLMFVADVAYVVLVTRLAAGVGVEAVGAGEEIS